MIVLDLNIKLNDGLKFCVFLIFIVTHMSVGRVLVSVALISNKIGKQLLLNTKRSAGLV